MSTQNEIRTRITADIVAALEKGGLPPWRCPWGRSGPPANAATGRKYSGINIWSLQLHRQRLGLSSGRFATFNQWREMGCRVKPRPVDVPAGRWGCTVVFCKPVVKQLKVGEGDAEQDEFLVLRHFTVFSADQVEGEPAERLRAAVAGRTTEFIDFGPAERAIAATGADIRHGGERAFYRRPVPGGDGDFIQMPQKAQFPEERDYYQTLLHELAGHWTEHRLGWTGSYAEGELRAEMAACFAVTDLGLPPGDRRNSAAYLDHWLKAMKADPQYVFRVTTGANRAANYFLSFSRQPQAEPEEPAVA